MGESWRGPCIQRVPVADSSHWPPHSHDEAGCTKPRWIPDESGKLYTEAYDVKIPESLASGTYTLKIKLRCPVADRDVLLALEKRRMDQDGYYAISEVKVR